MDTTASVQCCHFVKPKNLFVKISRLLIILFNLVPIIGVYFYDWVPFDMFWLFWVETLVLAFFNVVRVLYSQGYPAGTQPRAVPLQYHVGPAFKYLLGRIFIFWFYALFIIVFIGILGGPKTDKVGIFKTIFLQNPLFNLALLLSVASQAFYLIKYYFMNGRYYYSSTNDYPIIFDGRQIVIHVAVVLGAVGSTFLFGKTPTGGYAEVWVIGVLCVAKCIFELLTTHPEREHESALGSLFKNNQ